MPRRKGWPVGEWGSREKRFGHKFDSFAVRPGIIAFVSMHHMQRPTGLPSIPKSLLHRQVLIWEDQDCD